jgi:drug/metabolite transporter (DMT)-like permease
MASSSSQTETAASARGRPDVVRGIFLMCAGVAMFPFMNAAVKLLAATYPVPQIVWARFTGHLIFMLIVFLPRYGRALLATRRPAVQIARSVLMLASNLLFVIAIGPVPLATASAIGFTSPLIVTALSVPLLRETVGWRRWSAVMVGFVGALMVIRPGSGFHDPAVLLLLLSSAAYAVYQIATRWVSFYDNAATGIIFTALLGSLAMSLPLPFNLVLPHNTLDWLLFVSLGLLGGGGHRAVGLRRTDRHRDARLSDLRQFPRRVDLGRRRGHHRVRALHRVARAPHAQRAAAPLISSPRRLWLPPVPVFRCRPARST